MLSEELHRTSLPLPTAPVSGADKSNVSVADEAVFVSLDAPAHSKKHDTQSKNGLFPLANVSISEESVSSYDWGGRNSHLRAFPGSKRRSREAPSGVKSEKRGKRCDDALSSRSKKKKKRSRRTSSASSSTSIGSRVGLFRKSLSRRGRHTSPGQETSRDKSPLRNRRSRHSRSGESQSPSSPSDSRAIRSAKSKASDAHLPSFPKQPPP